MAGKAPRPGTPKPDQGGVALYNYALVDALLAIRWANMEGGENATMFHSSCNWFLTLADPTIDYYDDAWEKWREDQNLGTPVRGQPDKVILSKNDRMREVAQALRLLQGQGILWFKKGRYTGNKEQLEKFYHVEGDVHNEADEDDEG